MKGDPGSPAAAEGVLRARPGPPTGALPPGLHTLGLAAPRDAFLYVPAAYTPERPAPLAVMLHGAGGSGRSTMDVLRPFADARGLVLLAPDSRRETWDVIVSHYGRDVAFVDRALESVFSRVAVDPARVAVGGFSDGASYALSLGVMNGDLFTHVIAFSPGFLAPRRQQGKPRVYVSHGVHDRVLPVAACSRKVVPRLESAGYDVLYREFGGAHTVPAEVAEEAVD